MWADTGADGTEYPHSGLRLKSGPDGSQSVHIGCVWRYDAPTFAGGALWHRHCDPTPPHGLFATDGKPHPLQDTLLAVTLVLGITSFVTALVDDDLHLLSSWTGLVGILIGAYGQWISVTTRERFGLILGLGAAAVGFFLGMAHGGLFGGLID